MICCFHIVSMSFFFIEMYFIFKNMKFLFHKNVIYSTIYENTWVECPHGRIVGKRQTEENHPKVKLHKEDTSWCN